jgi:Protein of unknown function (DUF559)
MLAVMGEVRLSDLGSFAWVVTTAELLRSGLSANQVARLAGNGDLTPVSQGVYTTPTVAAQLRQLPGGELLIRAAAALATSGPGAVISHHTAAELHGLDLLTTPPGVAVTRLPGQGSRSGKTGVQVHVARLPASHISSRVAIPLTTVSRTVVDLARSLDFTSGVVVADSALHKRLTSKPRLHAVLAELPRSRGAGQAASVIDFADSLSESVLESIARAVFREHDLPPPELQVELGGGEFAARVDFYWREFRTVVEVDGAMKYDDRSAAMRQLRRDSRLRRAGFEVEHFTWREITETPGQVVAAIRVAFSRGLERVGSRRPASSGSMAQPGCR